jgi:hypothetical protein
MLLDAEILGFVDATLVFEGYCKKNTPRLMLKNALNATKLSRIG